MLARVLVFIFCVGANGLTSQGNNAHVGLDVSTEDSSVSAPQLIQRLISQGSEMVPAFFFYKAGQVLPSPFLHLPFSGSVLVWHLLSIGFVLIGAVAVGMTRKRRRLQQEEDANVRGGLALLWALSNKDISTRLAYFAKRKPREVLLSSDDSKLTVQEFEQLTLQGGNALLQTAAVKGQCVLVCFPRCQDFFTVIVSCLRAGQQFVPVSPEVARDKIRIQKLIAETGATAMITSESLRGEFKKADGAYVGIVLPGVKKEASKGLQDLKIITVGNLLRSDDKDVQRMRAPKSSDTACMVFARKFSTAPTTISFTHQNMIGMIDSWLQNGLHGKSVATDFGDHTDMTAISYALGTLCSGGRFVVPASEAKASPNALQVLDATHCLVTDDMQTVFDFSAKTTVSTERTLFVTSPAANFCDNANKENLKVRALYSTPTHVCGVAGIATKLTVHRDELLSSGTVKNLSLTTRIKQKAKAKAVDTVTFVSSGLPHDNVDLMIRRDDQCVEDDVVGEILVRSSLQATSKHAEPNGLAGFKSTGDFGFVSSVNYQLCITASQGDYIKMDGKSIVASELERSIEKQHPIGKATVFAVEDKEGGCRVVFSAEMKDPNGSAKPIIASLQKVAQSQKVPLGAIALLLPDSMPLLHGSSVVSRAALKMKYLEGNLDKMLASDGVWTASANKTETEHAVEENLDDVEACNFPPPNRASEAEGREFRRKVIQASAILELKKIGMNPSESSEEWLLGSQQMAQAAKRFERMLTTSDADWAKLGVDENVAPWGAGVFMRKNVEITAMMFLQAEGNVSKILEDLERAKFPTASEAAAIKESLKIETKLAPVEYEGTPMNMMAYRMLEALGSCCVALIMGLAVAGAARYYYWRYETSPATAFSETFPMFLNFFTILTCMCKWLLIGKYKPGAYARYTSAYFRWWFMDRLIETWESWAACWFMETIFLNLCYKAFGANIDWSTGMASLIREFDLIEVGADADITGELIPRIVTKDGVIMHKIFVGAGAKIDTKAYLPPNSTVEAGATVDKCEVVKSGSTVSAPALGARVANRAAGLRLQILQFLVMQYVCCAFLKQFISPHATALGVAARMYEPFWLLLGANAGLEGPIFIDSLRWVVYYMVFLWSLGAMLTAWCVIAKWCLFGRLKDGHRAEGLWWDLRVFALNWWWMLANMFFIQYWVDCSLLSITCYNLFGANVSYSTGLRFMQNMSPHHADFITIKPGANMSNARLHPSTAADRKVLKNIVLERNSFVGLMSIVQGGVTLGEGSSVATTTRCVSSVAPGNNLIGEMVQKQPKSASGTEMDFSQIKWHFYAADLLIALGLKSVVLAGYILGLTCTVATSMYAYYVLPLPLVIVVAALALAFFVGVVFGKMIEYMLHPRVEEEISMDDPRARLWLQYLQGLYLSQGYTFSMINGSWIAAWFHRMLGADTPLDAQWYTLTIRDQCLLTVGHNAVVDRDAYLVGHVGQPGGALSFRRAYMGEGAQLHPKSILFSGQRLGDNATLDFYSHSHLEKHVPEGKFYSGNPASHVKNSRIDEIAAQLPATEEQ